VAISFLVLAFELELTLYFPAETFFIAFCRPSPSCCAWTFVVEIVRNLNVAGFCKKRLLFLLITADVVILLTLLKPPMLLLMMILNDLIQILVFHFLLLT